MHAFIVMIWNTEFPHIYLPVADNNTAPARGWEGRESKFPLLVHATFLSLVYTFSTLHDSIATRLGNDGTYTPSQSCLIGLYIHKVVTGRSTSTRKTCTYSRHNVNFFSASVL